MGNRIHLRLFEIYSHLGFVRRAMPLLLISLPKNVSSIVKEMLGEFAEYLRHSDISHMQDVWSHRGPGGTRPFMMLDGIDKVGAELISVLAGHEDITKIAVADVIKAQYGKRHRSCRTGKT